MRHSPLPPAWINPNPNTTNIEFIHTLRSIAVLIVVFIHLGVWWTGTHNQNWGVYSLYKKIWVTPLNLYQDGGHLGVVIFFLISGYIITHVSLGENRAQFVLKRFFRLFPMLVVALLTMLAAALASRYMGYPDPLGFHGNFTIVNLLESILLINFPRGTPCITSVAWTLFIEAAFYVLIAVIIDAQHRRPLATTCYILAPLWAVAFLHHQTKILHAWNLSELASSTPYIAILALGRTFYFLHKTSLPKHWVIATSLACFLTFTLTYNLQWRGKLTSETLSTYYLGIIIFLAMMHWPDWKTPAPLGQIANTSYSIYLLHIPIGCLVLEIINPRAPFTIAFLAAFGMILLVSQGTYRWVEVPFQRLGRKLIEVFRSPSPTA